MPVLKSLPQAAFLQRFEDFCAAAPALAESAWPALLLAPADEAGRSAPSAAGRYLVQLLRARQAMLRAAFDTEQVADELRRYQKFVRPGRPSAQIVQLRQQQAAARQASNQSRQAMLAAGTAFVHAAQLTPAPRVGLEVFLQDWIDTQLPR